MIRRLFRLIVLSGLVAAAVSAYKALTRSSDPLPAPATEPSAPWPPLQPVATTAPAPAPKPTAAPKPAATPKPTAAPKPTATPKPTAAPKPAAGDDAWVEPTDDGECPPDFPVKAKLSSKIFHVPGQLNYDRTTPDRCYRDEASAVADGLRAAKR